MSNATTKKRTIKSKRLILSGKLTPTGVIYYSITKKDTDELIGSISYSESGEITYYIYEELRNNGFAKEALKVLINCVVKKPNIPFLRINKENVESKAVAKAVGFYLADGTNDTFDIWLLGAK